MSRAKVQPEDYVQFLLASPRQFTCAEAARVQPDGPAPPAHDSFTRLLTRLEPDPEELWREAEPLKGMISRRVITGERMMIAHVYLKKDDDVPRHSHENEQITYVLEGALHFWFGEDGAQELTVRAGEVIVIPSLLPHRALALEDTLDVDVFCPPRQDWLAGTDAYLRR